MLTVREAMHVWAHGEYGKSIFSAPFCCEPKSAPINNVNFFKKSTQGQRFIELNNFYSFIKDLVKMAWW